jgi:pyrophosphatase PpaX
LSSKQPKSGEGEPISHLRKLSCVIFDVDGTLTETNELIFAAFNHIAQNYLKRVFTPREITGMFGPPEEVAIEKLVGAERASAAIADFFDFYKSNFHSMARLHEGVKAILEFLKKKRILLAVFTGKGSHTTDITLAELGIRAYFDMVVTGHDVAMHKPSSEGIRKVISRYHLRPNEVLMIGDAVSDVRAAHEAGVPIAAVLWDSYGRDKVIEMEPDYLFDDVRALHMWLEHLLVAD